jgi:hypothetical protein
MATVFVEHQNHRDPPKVYDCADSVAHTKVIVTSSSEFVYHSRILLIIFITDALIGQIHEDIETTKTCLEEEVLKSYQTDGYFRI